MRNIPKPGVIAFVGSAILLSAAAFPASAQGVNQGQIIEGLSLKSAVLGRDVAYAVYLPPDYQVSKRRYPVVFLLHGYTDDESGWIQFGEIGPIADRALAERKIPPMIIVMPDGGVTWYINDYLGKVRFEDMFVRELIPFIDATYRTRPEREFRGVSGLSMGGWGTLTYALRHPDLFAACAAFSAGIWTDDEIVDRKQADFDRYFGPVLGPGLAGKERMTPHFRAHNPLDLARSLPEESLKKVDYYIDCGDDDFLIEGNCALHLILKERRIPHEFRVRDGGHTWDYWRTGIVDGLAFIGEAFHR
jgi:enterochelin esterase-like enzyme